jgi:hypothetical protein
MQGKTTKYALTRYYRQREALEELSRCIETALQQVADIEKLIASDTLIPSTGVGAYQPLPPRTNTPSNSTHNSAMRYAHDKAHFERTLTAWKCRIADWKSEMAAIECETVFLTRILTRLPGNEREMLEKVFRDRWTAQQCVDAGLCGSRAAVGDVKRLVERELSLYPAFARQNPCIFSDN